MTITINTGAVVGLGMPEKAMLDALIATYNAHAYKNAQKQKYYEGQISLASVNLGLALPNGLQKLEIGCAWGAKCVDVLAARSMFDGFVGENGETPAGLKKLVADNRLLVEYGKACRDELKLGCTFATLSADPAIGCRIRFHSPASASARWDGEKGRIAYGMAVIDTAPDNNSEGTWSPSHINLYTDLYVVELLRTNGSSWRADYHPHQMGRPLMEPLIWNATSGKPFGRSRIKEPVRRLIDGYVRTMANASIALEFATSPQKYLLGVDDSQYEAMTADKFKQYVGSILTATTNPDTGEKPAFGQLPQGTLTPHVEQLRMLATQFSAATGLPVTDTGVVNDANPTSSDAIEAQTKTLVGLAQHLNGGNAEPLRVIALMAQAIAGSTTIDGLSDDQRDVLAHFRNPAMPSIAVTADAAIKIATARPGFASTDTFLEMTGFDQAEIRRIRAQEARARGIVLADELAAEV